jgi:hypothetical protein
MTSLMTPALGRHATIRKILMGLVLAGVVGGLAAPARADERDHRDDHRRPDHHYRDDRHYGGRPGYVYAPPPVVYAAPPAPAALNFVFPLNFR